MRVILTRLLVPVVLVRGKLTAAFSCHDRISSLLLLGGRHHCPSRHYSGARSLPLLESKSDFRSSSPVDVLLPKENPFHQCWAADSWSVNAADNLSINELVRCFNSPAPPAFFALTRALELYPPTKKLEIFRLFTRMLKKGFHFVIRQSSQGDVMEWRILSHPDRIQELGPEWELVEIMEPFSSTVQIAHHLLELTTEASERHECLDLATKEAFVDLTLERLYITLGTECRGRSSADAAFAFAMAGVTRSELYQILANLSYLEVNRMGRRSTTSSRNILQIVEKLAAAGMRGTDVEPVYKLAAEILSEKQDGPDFSTLDALRNTGSSGSLRGGFGMHSTRSLLWLWRFATRQSKAKLPSGKESTLQSEEEDIDIDFNTMSLDSADWVNGFDDPYKPLVVDIGCGMGVSLLGLAGYQHHNETNVSPLGIDYAECNFVGGDLKSLLVGFSRGIATRWGLSGTTQFVHQSAEGLLQQLQEHYPGPIVLVMIQFPTPFRSATKTKDEGNSQLPADRSRGFMVTPPLLNKSKDVLQEPKNNQQHAFKPYLLLQSNCEDVAIAMREMALSTGLICAPSSFPVEQLPIGNDLPQRTQEWIRAGGQRPIGKEWSTEPLLPRNGQTETEVACGFNGIPVHRCLLTNPSN